MEAGRGRNPEVDIVFQLVDQQAKNIRIFLIDAKEVIQMKNVAQLCTYMFRLASADDLDGSSVVAARQILGGRVQSPRRQSKKEARLANMSARAQ